MTAMKGTYLRALEKERNVLRNQRDRWINEAQRLRGLVKRDQKDAARYRWIRDTKDDDAVNEALTCEGAEMDKAVDVAMARESR